MKTFLFGLALCALALPMFLAVRITEWFERRMP